MLLTYSKRPTCVVTAGAAWEMPQIPTPEEVAVAAQLRSDGAAPWLRHKRHTGGGHNGT
jgi:hypothetical protein